MNRRSASTALLVLSTSLFAPRAHAQYIDDTSGLIGPAMGALGAALYVVGGTTAFALLDARQLARSEPFSPVLSWTQAGFGSSLIAMGSLGLAANFSPELSWSLVATGSAFMAIPITEWAFRGSPDAPRTSLSLSPSGMTVEGQF